MMVTVVVVVVVVVAVAVVVVVVVVLIWLAAVQPQLAPDLNISHYNSPNSAPSASMPFQYAI
jgi:hypothetical protein